MVALAEALRLLLEHDLWQEVGCLRKQSALLLSFPDCYLLHVKPKQSLLAAPFTGLLSAFCNTHSLNSFRGKSFREIAFLFECGSLTQKVIEKRASTVIEPLSFTSLILLEKKSTSSPVCVCGGGVHMVLNFTCSCDEIIAHEIHQNFLLILIQIKHYVESVLLGKA